MSVDQRRFEVFVSSTYSDLREARQRVTMTLLECDAFPTGMEIFPAADDDAWTLIKQVIDQCDYYLLIIAGKYGSVDEKTGLSYTEMEYDYAVKAAKPVMAFLYRNLGELKSDHTESSEAAQKKLAAFRDKVKKAKHVKFWESPEELAGQVSLAYNKFARQYPATGWARADQIASAESLRELVSAKSRIEQLEAEVVSLRASAPAGAEDLAQGNDEHYISFRCSAKYKNVSGRMSSVHTWANGRPTWDELFAATAPQLLQEAEEDALKEAIEKFLYNRFLDEIAAAAIKKAKAEGVKLAYKDLFAGEAELDAEQFGTILVQLKALGLIRRSDRKRSIKDTGIYWALTPYGEARTTQLVAIKKAAVIPAPGDDNTPDA
jgi:hypothetical protein